ncbi:MAG: PaaI family thioesterase [Pseudomonadota bacterium]
MSDTRSIIEDPYHFQRLIGFRMVEWTAEKVVLHLPFEEKHTNRYGIPHGGVHALLLDTALGYAGCYTGDPDNKKLAMTLSITVSYLSRPKGTLLITEASKTGGGKSTFFAEGHIVDETGELIAKATGTFRYRRGPERIVP